jgi:hypothetical protein
MNVIVDREANRDPSALTLGISKRKSFCSCFAFDADPIRHRIM